MRKISDRDWDTYLGLYHAILDAIRPPDLLIYLRCSVRTLRRRIRLRGRAMEQEVPASYLRHLQALYDDWVARYALGEVLVLDTDRLDYIHDFVHRLDVMQRIERLLPAETLREP
jgi:deoxyadenosine/deoxycytidine kinase